MANIYAKWDSATSPAGMTIDGTGLIAGMAAGWSAYESVRCDTGKISGKWTVELTPGPDTASTVIGLGDGAFSLIGYVGQNAKGIGLYLGGYVNNVYTPSGTPLTYAASPIMVAYDVDAGKGWYGRLGAWANGGDPASGTSPSFTFTPNDNVFIACSINSSLRTVTLNAGQSAFSSGNSVPVGFNVGLFSVSTASAIPLINNQQRIWRN